MSDAIKEISADELADKIETNQPLSTVERMAIGAILRVYGGIQKSGAKGGRTSRGGGRKRIDNPSPSALYQRERRANKKKESG